MGYLRPIGPPPKAPSRPVGDQSARSARSRPGHLLVPMVGLASALVALEISSPLAAQGRGSLQVSARVLPSPARVVLDSALQVAAALVRRPEGAAGSRGGLTWAAVRLAAEPGERAGRRQVVVTVSYVRN